MSRHLYAEVRPRGACFSSCDSNETKLLLLYMELFVVAASLSIFVQG